ncbi:antibiotic biosynthesis monooxygenase [Exiguobacterium sp. A1_3_1]|uniref:Quinol monooxygenase n=1 Tax=Exiguobacterium indicum TaxID=296995 RepID=A0ABU8EJ54_9BACL|nr:putative quinol monooxygenase [Exiguobacterium sp. JMULE1]NTY08376.1 antibiotic biosynthesis monooxygenase [Exiguobacterium sp. JMULE1]
MGEIVVNAILTIKAGLADQVFPILQTVYHASQKEEGCLRYSLHQSIEDEHQFMLYEVYRDEEALEAHIASDHYKAYREQIELYLMDRQVTKYVEMTF